MARKKSKFMDDGSDTSSDEGGDDKNDFYDPNDLDQAAESELFHNPGGRNRKRGRGKSGEDYDEEEEGFGGNRRGETKRVDLLRGQAFVSSGSAKATKEDGPAVLDNLSTTYSIDQQPEQGEFEEDEEMNLGEEEEYESEEDVEEENEEEELVAIPGIAPIEVEIVEPILKDLPFAPRGLGSRGKGGIGARAGISGGIGSARAGIGGGSGIGSSSSKVVGAAPMFASATSASNVTLGSLGSGTGLDTKKVESNTVDSGVDIVIESASRGGIGSSTTVGLGAKPKQSLLESLRAAKISENPASPASITPTVPVPRQSFLSVPIPTVVTPAAPMSASEKQHFAKLSSSNSLGLKMLEKMGWKSGSGLGMNEQGIITPIGEGTKVRPMKMGLAYDGFGERSSGAKEEGRRRGEVDEEDSKGKGKGKARQPKEKKEKPAWQQPSSKKKEVKIKTEYKTYEEIVADQGGEPEGVGMLVDLSGNALSNQSLSNLPAYGAGSADPTRLPELRHNLTLLTSTVTSSLSALAREGKSLEERKNYITKEENRVNKVVLTQERSIQRLRGIMEIVGRISEREKEVNDFLSAIGEEEISVEDAFKGFGDDFDSLLGDYAEEYEEMRLDEVVVGGIANIMRKFFQNWNPLTDPTYAVEQLKKWRKHFLIDKNLETKDNLDVNVYGSASFSNGGSSRKASDRVMTPFETMMWTIWLPRVRSALNNAWSPSDPAPAVALFTAWSSLLPSFLRDNILDQLILPKLSKAIGDWSPSAIKRGGVGLHVIVFPWLELTGTERMEIILEEARRKVRSWLKSWKVRDGVPTGMDLWKDAFSTADWDALIIKNVLPQLGVTLREEFVINPRAQELKPLENVLAWRNLLRSSILSQLLETSFFDRWLDALYLWLTHDPNFDQVAEWYSYWKSYFPDEVVALSGVARGFRKGLDLMNQASALGDDAKYRLKRPDTSVSMKKSSKSKSKLPSTKPTIVEEITFKSIVTDFVSESNLIFLSTGKAHENHTLFKISKTVDGKSGVTIYLDDDVVWLLDKGEYKPIGLEEMVAKALK